MAHSKHKLGFGLGKMIDKGDGTVEYDNLIAGGQNFTLRVADITGFSLTKGKGTLDYTFHIFGNGTTLAELSSGSRQAKKLEEWLRAHPDFETNASAAANHPAAPDLAAQLANLAGLRDSGALSEVEFEQAKSRLLG